MPSARIRWRVTERPESWDRESIDRSPDRPPNPSPEFPGRADPRYSRFTWLNQVHGTAVVTVSSVGLHRGAAADAAVTTVPDAVLVVRSADCAPVLFEGVDSNGVAVLGVAHAGWRGLLDGVIEATVRAMQDLGGTSIGVWLGPCIGPECYEFGAQPLDELQRRFGDSVESVTAWGTKALDMPAAVQSAVVNAGAGWRGRLDGWSCTSCDHVRRFSHRARGDHGRLALIAQIRSDAVDAVDAVATEPVSESQQ